MLKGLISCASMMSNRMRFIGLFPYLSTELIAAIMKPKSVSAPDLRMDSESATENSVPAIPHQSAVDEQSVMVKFQVKAAYLLNSRLYDIVAGLVAPWFP
jgi:hypothetical protein